MNAALNKYQGPISLALLGALVLVAGLLALTPVLERFDLYDQTLFRDGRMLQRLQSIEASRAELESTNQSFQGRNLGEWVYNSSTNAAAIGLDIQRRVTTVLAASQAPLRSITPLPAQRREGFTVVGVRVNFSGSLPALMESLRTLEQSKPLLVIEDFRVNPANTQVRPQGVPAEQVTEVQMSVVTLLPIAPDEPATQGGGQ